MTSKYDELISLLEPLKKGEQTSIKVPSDFALKFIVGKASVRDVVRRAADMLGIDYVTRTDKKTGDVYVSIIYRESSTQAIRLWEVEDSHLIEISKSKLDLEERLEDWLEFDISIIESRMMVIGRQVETDFGGYIDLLCLNEDGDIIIVELKREKTPREITAQILDYASWVKGLSGEHIERIANDYLGEDGPLEEAFQRQLQIELPDSLNENHEMLIVASEIDSSSQRIVNYLSETYGTAINIVTFNYFKRGEKEYIARTFLIEPSKADFQQRRRATSKRVPDLSFDELQSIADEKGVGEVYRYMTEELRPFFTWTGTTRSSITFQGKLKDRRLVIFSLIPKDSDETHGVRWQLYFSRFMRCFGLDEDEALKMLPDNKEEWEYYRDAPEDMRGYAGYMDEFSSRRFVNNLTEFISKKASQDM